MEKISLHAAIVRGAQICQAKNDLRYYFNGIFLAPNGDVVGTNGHMLFVCPDAFVVPSGFSGLILQIYGAIPISAIEATFDFDANVVKTGNNKAFVFEEIKGTYPDYHKAIPAKDHDVVGDTIAFNPRYLAKIAKIYPRNGAKLYHSTSDFAMLVTPIHGDRAVPECLRNSFAILSPMGLPDDDKGNLCYPK